MAEFGTGSATVPMPSLGSWLSYGLGTFNVNLPSYVILDEHMPYAGAQNWDCNFLPPLHQGVRVVPGKEPIPDLRSPAKSVTLQELEQIMLRDVNELHAKDRPGDLNLRRRQSDLLEKRRQRFQARWCSQEDRPDGILAAAERDRVFGRGEIDRGTGSAVVGGRAATFSCDGRMLADDCIPPDTSIRDFARSTG